MGCSIKTQYRVAKEKRISLIIQPSSFITENQGNFQNVYRLGKLLGTGSFGEVRVCTHRVLEVKRAVKIIRKDMVRSVKHRHLLNNEIKILKTLDHPNIIRIHEFFEDLRRLYIVMEYVKGRELFQELMRKGSLNEKKAANIMKQIFITLEYLEIKGVSHRDLKPENILLEEKNGIMNIKIIDFGTATVNLKTENMTRGAGTIFYMSPEVLAENPSCLCDIWSAGVILYVLLSGYPPFNGKNNEEIHAAIVSGKFSLEKDPWPEISDLAKDFINKLICPEAVRYNAKQASSHDWIKQYTEDQSDELTNHSQVLKSLKSFRATTVLRDAVKTYITSQYISNIDTKDLKESFIRIDKNHDGKISYDELLSEYSMIMDLKEAQGIANSILKEVDTDKNGYIDYYEFLRATLDSRKFISQHNLTAAFKMFDQDGNGKISSDDIERIFNDDESIEPEMWKKLIQEVDLNGDGEIDVTEFCTMLESLRGDL
jgi:calcium-dependent protein kinase